MRFNDVLWFFVHLFVQVLLSGGVDSTVCAAMLSQTVDPAQIVAVHIDNGFMRKNESTSVVESLKALKINGKYSCIH